MNRTPQSDLRIAALFCGILALCDVVYVVLIFSRGLVISPLSDVLFPDFLVFYAAVQTVFDGKLSLLYDVDAFTQYQNSLFGPERLAQPVHFRPFFYPPSWLLILLPFGLLGVVKAYAVFMTATAGAATALVGRRDWLGWLAVVTSPAAMWVVLAGQNTLLSIALMYGGLRLLDRVPAAAGILLGLLSYKPQMWLLVPLALIAAARWKALAWMAATAALLALASAAAFGPGLWLAFFDAASGVASERLADSMFEHAYMHMTTLLASARIVGLAPTLSVIIQLIGTGLAVAAVWQVFRRHGSSDARTAVLVAGTFLVSPYILNYDLLLLMPAVVALFRLAAVQGFYPAERVLYGLLWVLPTLALILNRAGLPIVPLVVLGFGLVAWLRLNAQSKVELPAVAAAR
jgi:alpha-1,2-mannosyltransferase